MTEAHDEQRLRELFDRAISLPPAERDRLLAGVQDEVLAERLRALLLQDAHGTAGVLERSPAAALSALRRIGRYELLRELGRGGMGTVVLARQVEPVERLVAIKMISASNSREVEQRFAAERQAMAMMDHPGIAQVYDGGTTDDGLPYFVMEYVRGEPITAYCDRRQLDCDARIDLFVKVCDAVQHAHQKAVLHRDLKPGNVLVTEIENRVQPKVIDFGVARALGAGGGAMQPTSGGVMVGTFAYMSPEQADTGGQGIDTRTDIYSLGAMLYELLTGELPLHFDPAETGLLGLRRALLETVPPPASVRVSGSTSADREQHARCRGTSTANLARLLRVDLDWILMKALEKDRNRRYASAAEFADDLQRYRRFEPVTAGPPTVRYRLAKFVRRNRATVLGTAVVLLALAAGAAFAVQGMFAARTARDVEVAARRQQERQLQRERAVGDYFEFLLLYGDPGTGVNPPPLRQVLDGLVPTIAPRFVGRPMEAAAVHAGVGRAYLASGEPAKAEQQLSAAWALTKIEGDGDAADASLLLYDLLRARGLAGGQRAQATELAELLSIGARSMRAALPDVAGSLDELAALLRAEGLAAGQLPERCEQLLVQIAGLPSELEATRLAARLLSTVGIRLQEEDRPGSDRLVHRIEAIARSSLGNDIAFLQVLSRFAERQLMLGRHDDAQRLAAEVRGELQRLGLREHWLFLQVERIRGLAASLGGEPAEGEAALVQLQRRLWFLPPSANEKAKAAANVLAELCTLLAATGRLPDFFAASLQRWQQTAAADPAAAPWWPADAEALPDAARSAARAVVAQRIEVGDSPQLQFVLGALLLREDRAQAATAALLSAVQALTPATPELLADLAIARHRLGEAAESKAVAEQLRARGDGVEPDDARQRRALQRLLAAGLR